MENIDPKQLSENFFEAISKQWMLITSGQAGDVNTMTASWGGIGFLWNRPVVYIFIRPERHTHTYLEKNERFSLTFFDEKHRSKLVYCGKMSGRDCDKIKDCGLTLLYTENNTPYFEEARLMIECRKFYKVEIKDGEFEENSSVEKWYKSEGVHTMFVGQIENCFYL